MQAVTPVLSKLTNLHIVWSRGFKMRVLRAIILVLARGVIPKPTDASVNRECNEPGGNGAYRVGVWGADLLGNGGVNNNQVIIARAATGVNHCLAWQGLLTTCHSGRPWPPRGNRALIERVIGRSLNRSAMGPVHF